MKANIIFYFEGVNKLDLNPNNEIDSILLKNDSEITVEDITKLIKEL